MSTEGVVLIVALIIFSSVIILKRKNLFYFKKNNLIDNKRVVIEDSLKHLYDCEFKGVDCSLSSLAGNLNIKSNETTKVIAWLESMELIKSDGIKISLTPEGRSYALRIVRIHRLWERYLADNTSVEEKDWHKIAEEREHLTSIEDARKLAARLGNPLFDPHGDPIPLESGEVLSKEGIQLNKLEEKNFARIIHLEDEPKEVYAQLIALKLYPGMQIFVLENSKEKIVFEADGQECVLAPVLAANITVEKISEKETIQEKFETLSSLNVEESATVIGISKAMRGQQRRRMLDFGIVPGTVIKAQLKSLKGDPAAYNIRGALIALRKNQSDLIHIKRNNVKEKI